MEETVARRVGFDHVCDERCNDRGEEPAGHELTNADHEGSRDGYGADTEEVVCYGHRLREGMGRVRRAHFG